MGYDYSLWTDDERSEFDNLISGGKPWQPLAGPQTQAYESLADVTGYGGSAGGGKTSLAIGTAITNHRRVGIFRENGTELTAIVDDIAELVGGRDDYNGADKIWRMKRYDGQDLQIELGSFPHAGDEKKYQGRPHDLLVFDEAANMREMAVRFLMGWLRSTAPGQRCRAIMCFNPPTTVEGRWIIQYFAPWLDLKHPNPAKAGELRYFTTVKGVDVERPNGDPFEFENDDGTTETMTPMSRTFIPSRVTDNKFLMGTSYYRTLQAMPEPLRSQMLHGDFQAGIEDDPWQVIPTSWIEASMERWTRPAKLEEMDSQGVDVAMGGKDKTVIANRHGMWFDHPTVHPGHECVDGPTIAAFVLAKRRDQAVIHIDLFGVGAQPFGHIMGMGVQIVGCNVGDPAQGVAEDSNLQFFNWRTELWWRMREALDPAANTGICLPPDRQLLADLCTPKWDMIGSKLKVQSTKEMMKNLGRSPDYGSAYVLALINTPKRAAMMAMGAAGRKREEYDPYKDY